MNLWKLFVVLATLSTLISRAAAAPANDNFANRIVLVGSSLTATGYNVGATAETGEPNPFSTTSHRSVWWTWTAPNDGSVRITTIGSGSADTTLAIYTNSTLATLGLVASDDDSGGANRSLVTFNAIANVQYQILVDRFDSTAVSTIVVNLHMLNTPPSALLTTPTDTTSVTQPYNATLGCFASDYLTTNALSGVTNLD